MKLPKVGRLLLTALLIAGAAASLTACNKPSESSCRQALANMQRLMGTENVRDPEQLEGEVRRCKGGSKKAAVACAIKAQTFDELKHCNFYHLPDNLLPSNLRDGAGTGSAAMTGSATGSAGSAAMGSAAGSAAMGSAAMGSAAGSAAMGSAAMGSAADSAAMGSAKAPTGAGSAAKGSAAKGSAATGSAAGSAAK